MDKFTPGPWTNGYTPSSRMGCGYGKSQIISADGRAIGGVAAVEPNHGEMYEKSGLSQATLDCVEANACLMAAAPEMLKGLEAVIAAFKHHDPKEQNRRVHAIWRELVDICAKARGDEPCYGDKRAAKALAKVEG